MNVFLRVFVAISSAAALCCAPLQAQTHTLDKEKGAALLEAAASQGIALPTQTVQNSVGVTAVMLTQGSVARIFGKEISNTYAVVQLTISNKSQDAAFVLHSAYIDTSQWALGGGTRGFAPPTSAGGANPATAASAGTRPNQIASAEARIARGQLLDAQQWSARNWTVRLLTLAGSLSSSYSFAFKEIGIAKGIAAFSGSFVPGVAMAWPDGAVAQLNRISDFGYQTNKVIPKGSADIVVCFFPIDMFLSSPFRSVFLSAPGLFASPYQILFTPQNRKYREMLGIDEKDTDALRKLHGCYSKSFEPAPPKADPAVSADNLSLMNTVQTQIAASCGAIVAANKAGVDTLDYIGRFGLQNIGVFVDGSMTVDADLVPASIDQITFDGDPSKPDFWATPGAKKATIQCRFCQGGQVSIVDADKLGITDIKTADDADGKQLDLSFTLTKAIETGQALTFSITKKSTDPKKAATEVKGTPFTLTVAYVVVAPAISNVTVSDGKVTVAGTGFFNTKTNPLSASLHAATGKEKDVAITLPDGQAADKLTFPVPANLPPGCWAVQVKLNQMDALSSAKTQILSAATPTLSGATRGTDAIAVKGTQLVDTSACGGAALKFQLLKADSKTPVDVTSTIASSTEASLVLPADAKTGDWTVQVLVGDKVAATVALK